MGYIYIRTHHSYEKFNSCKLGKTKNIIERESLYITCEIEKGNFELILKVDNEDIVEYNLKNYFKKNCIGNILMLELNFLTKK